MDQMRAEYNKNRLELHNNLAELDKIIERIDQQMAHLPEVIR